MKRRSAVATVAVICALGSGGALGASAIRAASANTNAPQQKVYLDPQTGEVLDAPPAGANDEPPARAGAAQRSAPAQSDAWTNDDGAEMLTPAPGSAPTTHAVRCKDGTLRMGHADSESATKAGDSERDALCDRPIR